MGMFDTLYLQGKVKDVANSIIPGVDGELQTKELDLELCRYHVGDDFILKNDPESWERHKGLVEFEIIKAGNFTRLIESRWSANDGSVFLNFVNNRLTFIAHIHCFGWFPIPHPRAKDKVIFFDEDEILVVELDHEAKDVDQRALDAYYQIMKSEIGDAAKSHPLYKALVEYYKIRQTWDPKAKDAVAFRNMLDVRSEASRQNWEYSKITPITGVHENLSPMAIMSLLHRKWTETQNSGDDKSYHIDANFDEKGFDGRFPQELLNIYELSWEEVFGMLIVPQKTRPNLDFSSVHYGD